MAETTPRIIVHGKTFDGRGGAHFSGVRQIALDAAWSLPYTIVYMPINPETIAGLQPNALDKNIGVAISNHKSREPYNQNLDNDRIPTDFVVLNISKI